jgi:uncharacterized protein YjbI with pentapeptide repeats
MELFKIRSRITGAILYEGEAASLRDLVIKAVSSRADLYGADLYGANLSRADLSGANLSRADLYEANLYGANLSGANLSRADLSGANLYGANLSRADLSGANLYGANLSGQHLISFAGIGSARRSTTYWVEADEVRCGCFTGTLEEFAEQVQETHEDNPKHLAEYQAGIAFLKACVAAIPVDEAEKGRKKYAEMKAAKEPKYEARHAQP